ncbi:preprotein translocase subunit SecA [Murdochiella vaginalis]|uniref:preprotein translocase subunit SecA n=1 Tax=Murdochiella vaginalis TaxID=1852373 RepID=UPI0008FE5141|nr:preprotein translocase subunit SecA [Murdochiella vaginalis]
MGLFGFLTKSFSEKEIDKIRPQVDAVLALEPEMAKLSDSELRAKTEEYKKRYQDGETLDALLPEAFATVREAAWRVLGMKPYPVQVIGGIILHQGRIAEMKTGEGKTLVATMPAYLNALAGEGVHIVTVNDYLAQRDAEWMGKVHQFLGLTVGVVLQPMEQAERQHAYNADITYGTNNQFGFDYLRDNMAIYKSGVVQRKLHYAIVDEVDSILIDEARTPLIISGMGDPSTEMYSRADVFVQTLEGRVLDPNEELNKLDSLLEEHKLETVDYVVDEKRKTANLTEQGNGKAEAYFHVENISDPTHMELMHYINQALKARTTMRRDIDYVVDNDEVKIVDEFTGRIMEGRRYSEGLHQAIEAKEGVTIKSESKTLATVTFQNFFRMYEKLAGMTGTGLTEADEFSEIYHMDVIEIPTNRPIDRTDREDAVYAHEEAKFRAIVREIQEIHATGQPILVGTVDIETSEKISKMLKKVGIKHHVLNAKQHRYEAEIVAQAGRFGEVTIATNMAGRGTDIVLGGNAEWMAKKQMEKDGDSAELIEWADSFRHVEPEETFPANSAGEESEEEAWITGREILDAREKFQRLKKEFSVETKENAEKVKAVGGLFILGTERHEARRIDNQLRGRSGRQGDPGASQFYISLEDKLMRLFGSERMQKFVESGAFPEDEPIQAGILTKSIERAQKKVESNNFATRKQVLDYDNIMNMQRNTVYGERNRVLNGEDMRDEIVEMIHGVVSDAVDSFCGEGIPPEQWEMEGLFNYLNNIFLPKGAVAIGQLQGMKPQDLKDQLTHIADDLYARKEEEITPSVMREVERMVLLRAVDTKWMDHIDAMDQLRKGIGIRAMGNEDPVRAFANEGYDMFNAMNESIREETVRVLYHIEPPKREVVRTAVATPTRAIGAGDEAEPENRPFVRKNKKIGRNDPCPCGSGKKYKNCHGRFDR